MAQVDPVWKKEVLRHSDWLRSVVRARLGSASAVDDIVQDVFSDALSIGSGHESIQHPAPWLYRIAIRKVLLWRRATGRQRKALNRVRDGYSSTANPGTAIPLDLLLQAESSSKVRQALQRISGRDAEILVLKYIHGWSYDGISQNLGIDKTKIAHRLRRARQRLRTELAEYFEGEFQ